MDHYVWRTYRSVWNWQHKIYSVTPGMPLWWPVTFVYLGCLAVAAVIVWVVTSLGPVEWLLGAIGVGGLIPRLILPFLLASWLQKGSLDGKTPFTWLRSQIRYLWRPRRWQRCRPVPTWWLGLPPAVAYRVWGFLGWDPLPPERPAPRLRPRRMRRGI
jgi:hypothetical protein